MGSLISGPSSYRNPSVDKYQVSPEPMSSVNFDLVSKVKRDDLSLRKNWDLSDLQVIKIKVML